MKMRRTTEAKIGLHAIVYVKKLNGNCITRTGVYV
jgi:hypothetical protein